ncbi:hypothetical protein ACFSOZ_16205 [Mesorhizobium newzealandense]|uniref:MAPEG family protein n=1 Tax=Mesorhizobium newzealandense TaxID=1300302 RepID=A0ABW4UEV3_9HYPH
MLEVVLLALAGLLVALGAGHFVTNWFHGYLTDRSGLKARSSAKRLPPWITGTFERTLTFALLASQFPDPHTVILAWLAAKFAANWQRDEPTGAPEAQMEYRSRAMIAVMSGIVSVAFGYVGGWIVTKHC